MAAWARRPLSTSQPLALVRPVLQASPPAQLDANHLGPYPALILPLPALTLPSPRITARPYHRPNPASPLGTLGLVDHDAVEVSNLQRQVLHEPSRAGTPKAESGAASVRRLNPHVRCHAHVLLLTAATARPLVAPYDIVLDCTDNVATRYLLNDVCVLLGKPLVSGAALRWEGQVRPFCAFRSQLRLGASASRSLEMRAEARGQRIPFPGLQASCGPRPQPPSPSTALNPPSPSNRLCPSPQLTVYHHANGPCYRCLFPTPPPPDTVARCGDVGVLGPGAAHATPPRPSASLRVLIRTRPRLPTVTGTIGVLQALEAVKLALGLPRTSPLPAPPSHPARVC